MSGNRQVTIVDEDRLCYIVLSVNNGANGLRTISKALLHEFVHYFIEHPDASASDAREALKGKSDLDKFEYGYNSTLALMAKMILGYEDVIFSNEKLVQDKSISSFAYEVFRYLEKHDFLKSLEDYITYSKASNYDDEPLIALQSKKHKDERLVNVFIEKDATPSQTYYYDTPFNFNGRTVYLNNGWSKDDADRPDLTLRKLADVVNESYSHIVEIVKRNGRYVMRINDFSSLPLQQIFYGAPGTGKSNTIKKEVEEKKRTHFRTTFHPDSDYSTFVGAYKPVTSKSATKVKQPILDYDSLVDKFKEYLTVPNINITKACTLFGFDYHDSIVRIQENGRRVMDLVNDAYKSNTTYDSVVRGGMACYEQNPTTENTSKISYKFIPQAFTKAYVKAWQSPDEPVFLIIEEINRGNCAQIFGDLFQLLDRKDGVSEYPIKADQDLQMHLQEEFADYDHLPETIKSGEELKLPANLYIWATMNTSDQSLFPIDSAFKRRWDWKYMKIKNHPEENFQIKVGEEQKDWWGFIKKVNEIIASMTSSADKQLGYFFCKAKDGVIDEETFVAKVIFYLWNDVFKDYGFEDSSLFRYTDSEGKEHDLTFPDFYDEDGGKVNTARLADFVQKVMDWTSADKNEN